MKIHFLGGAHEVGGSCTLLEFGGRRILVDAGVKMGGKTTDRLPDLGSLSDGPPLDAILITHAHADHIGALPLVHLAFPTTPLYTTGPTLELMRVLLADSLKIMESRWEHEQEIPLYPDHAVASLLARIQKIPINETVPLCNGSFGLHFRLAGHVLGSCSLQLDTPEGRIFFTGDYSVDPQRTVDGFQLPPIHPHVVITEATYGNRLHANRRAEEHRLAQTVAEVIGGGGKVLIPAFALGRAQEALLILLHEQQAGRIPAFPIYADGMVRAICGVYPQFPDYLGARLAKQVRRSGDPFFGADSPAKAVKSPVMRQQILAGGPCCIISSSGMLTGGPSQMYAAELATDPKNAIFLTGYQDEESPGRRVLALTEEGSDKTLRLGDRLVQIACRVDKYGLSAHADAAQITSVVSKLAPHVCYLVHGDESARYALTQSMPSGLKVVQPFNGQIFDHEFGAVWKLAKLEGRGLGQGQPFNPERLRQLLLSRGDSTRTFTTGELGSEWFGPGCTPEQLATVSARLDNQLPAGWARDPRRPELLSIVVKKRSQLGALKVAQSLLQPLPEVKGVGERQAERELIISTPFPDSFARRHNQLIEQLQGETGYRVTFKAGAGPQAFAEAAAQLFPGPGWKLTRPPSIRPGYPVRLRLRLPADALPQQLDTFRAEFYTLTGYQVELDLVADPANAAPPKELFDQRGRMEPNAAYRMIRSAIQDLGLEVFRCGLKSDATSDYIEVGLLAPWLLDAHATLLERLTTETGYPVRVRPGLNVAGLTQKVQGALPKQWQLKRPPRWFAEQRQLALEFLQPPSPQAFRAWASDVEQQSGVSLLVLV